MPEPKYEPTREEIAAECAKIRESWDEKEHWQRLGYPEGRPVLEVTRVRILREGRRL